MALMMIDGFGHYASGDRGKKWSVASSEYGDPIMPTGGRGGRGGYRPTYSRMWATFASRTSLVMGFAHQIYGGTVSGPGPLMAFGAVNAANVYVKFNMDGSITAYVRTGTNSYAAAGSSAPGALDLGGNWAYFEVKAFCSATVGAIEIRVNAATVLTVNNINTDYAGTGGFSMAGLLTDITETGGVNSMASDFYLLDTSGTVNNDFLGDSKVETLPPTRDGAVQQFTPSTAGAHYPLVDDPTLSATDYTTGTATGQTELFGFRAIAANPLKIHGVQVVAMAGKTDAGSRTMDTLAAIDGTQYPSGQPTQLRVGATAKRGIFDLNPATGAAWLKPEIAAAEFGVVTGA